MLCPYHGSYNAKLDRCPGCVESRLRTVTTAGTSLEVQPESDELATLRERIAAAVARCSELHKAHDRARCGDPYADGYDVGIRQAAEEIRAVLEGR